jgi:hypothetical protein
MYKVKVVVGFLKYYEYAITKDCEVVGRGDTARRAEANGERFTWKGRRISFLRQRWTMGGQDAEGGEGRYMWPSEDSRCESEDDKRQ